MEKNGILAVFFLFSIVAHVAHVSDASLFRRLEGEAPIPNSNNSTAEQQISPLPNPVSSGMDLYPKPKDDNKSDEEKKRSEDPQVPNNSSVVDPKGLNATSPMNPSPTVKNDTSSVNPSPTVKNDTSLVNPSPTAKNDSGLVNPSPTVKNDTTSVSPAPTVKQTDDQKSDQEVNKDDNKTPSQEEEIHESCDELPNRCTDDGSLVACVQPFESGSKELVILVQNEGKKTLRVNLIVPTSVESSLMELQISKHQTKKINISLDVTQSNKIIFNAGSGECVLHTAPILSEGNFFLRLPSFDKLVTPINGAYFLILTVVIFGGTLACCKFRKTRRHDGIPYQELEMGLPESVSATNVETAEGWDQGWDDDWDEGNAVKSPMGHTAGSISANGLTARSSNRDGWENDWDD